MLLCKNTNNEYINFKKMLNEQLKKKLFVLWNKQNQ